MPVAGSRPPRNPATGTDSFWIEDRTPPVLMPDFVHRRVSSLVDEAKEHEAAGDNRVACERILTACDLLERTFGSTHRKLPELFQFGSDLSHRIGDEAAADWFQTRAWEMRHFRARYSRRLLAISRLGQGRIHAAAQPTRWPAAVTPLVERIRGDALLEPAPEVVIFGPPRSGRTHLLHVLGHEAIDRPWPTRLDQGYDLIDSLDASRRSLRRYLARLDRYAVMLVDELDPWSLTRVESRLLQTVLLHRRDRRCTVLAIRTHIELPYDVFLENIQRTTAFRYLNPAVLLLGLPGKTTRVRN